MSVLKSNQATCKAQQKSICKAADFVILTNQYDKQMLVILSLLQKRRKIHKFKIYFKFKAKNSYFDFMDTSLRSV